MTDVVNPTNGFILLISWSVLAGVWWLIATVLVFVGPRRKRNESGSAHHPVTVFKPIPPVRDETEQQLLAGAIESFISQLERDDELLIGVDQRELSGWEGVFNNWRSRWPDAQIVIVAQAEPRQLSNPKVAWMQVLSAKAHNDAWLWSDADVIVEPGFLRTLRNALNDQEASAVTAAYAVRHVNKPAAMFDALFVNVEFLPGALLLERIGSTEFAYGAAILFRARTFRERVDWADLGARLADDHELGRRLRPVKVLDAVVSTFTLPGSWGDALKHYYRWQKTVRWCRPAGYAALILVIPLAGWAIAVAISAGGQMFAAGFLGQWLFEILVCTVICLRIGCRLPPLTWPGLMLWPLVRMIAWMLAWLPLPVVWGRREAAWSAPTKPAGIGL